MFAKKLDITGTLLASHYIYLESFMHDDQCDRIIETFQTALNDELEVSRGNLSDSDDMLNRVYKSSRSPLRYCYLQTEFTKRFNRLGIERLNQITGMNWNGNINDHCLPVFEYGKDGYIKAHRGRDIGYGANDFVAVLMLTDHGSDFLGGEFYLNPNAEASADGKTVTNDRYEDRIYFKQKKGSLVIFNNRLHVHGTSKVRKGSKDEICRMTTSWRMAV